MKTKIGEMAGRVWTVLEKKKRSLSQRFPKFSKKKGRSFIKRWAGWPEKTR